MPRVKKKKVHQTESADNKKTAGKSENPDHYRSQFIAWHFHFMDSSGNWPCSMNDMENIRERLHQYEQMVWSKLLSFRSNHKMPVERISTPAQKRLSKLKLDDAANLYQLEIKGLGGKGRLWGLRWENVFQILWWDPNHTVYPTRKKNT